MPPLPGGRAEPVRLREEDVPVDVGQDEIEGTGRVQSLQGSLKDPQTIAKFIDVSVPAAAADGIAVDVQRYGAASPEEQGSDGKDPRPGPHIQDRSVLEGADPFHRFYAADSRFVKTGTESPASCQLERDPISFPVWSFIGRSVPRDQKEAAPQRDRAAAWESRVG